MFLLMLPTLISAFYLFALAAEQYESEARFVVRSASRPNMPGALGFLVQLGIARSQDDAFVVQEYMTSRDAIARLSGMMKLRDIYRGSDLDFVAHYPSMLFGPESEEFHRYFQRMVSVVHTDKTGISTLKVRAFSAADAHRIAAALLGLAEELVNRLNERSQHDAIRSALTEVQLAQSRLIAAQAALTEFRNVEQIVDPTQTAVRLSELIGQLAAELGGTQSRIHEMHSGTSASPQLGALQRKASALQKQIEEERGRISSDSGLATRIAKYDRLKLERQFAEKTLSDAETELVLARAEAAKQLLYLARVVEPSEPDYPAFPKRVRTLLTILCGNILLVMIGWLVLTGVSEHGTKR
ncbi:hypothetical protein [Reyranella sp.]|uniref:hypothetical protein n=1 Tax=Reyranella sp. TaxID=1929291 RepID=UPI003C7A795B